jgi:GntR family transcriptional regulator
MTRTGKIKMHEHGTEVGKKGDVLAKAGETAHPYKRLQSELASLIAATPPGGKLLAEPELARQLGVSRATLREAMRLFEGQGMIRRRQGVGTFVVGPAPVIESGLEMLESIETMAQKIGLVVTMGDLEVSETWADEVQAEALEIEVGRPLVQVARVIHTENHPVAYLVDVLPEDVLPPHDIQSGFTGSVLDLLLRRGSPRLVRSVAEIRATAATAEIARLLQIQRGDVLLMFSARLYTIDEQVVDYSLSYFLPGYFRFHIVRRVGEA